VSRGGREREREKREEKRKFRDETLNYPLIFGGGRIFEKKKKNQAERTT